MSQIPTEEFSAPAPSAALVSGEAPRPRFANFDLLRLIAAGSVIFSHAFVVLDGGDKAEPLARLLGPGNILGRYGVYTFFVISGYLITASFLRSPLTEYLLKRSLRILPGLIVCTLVTVAAALLWRYHGRLPAGVGAESTRYALRTILLQDTSSRVCQG